MYIFINLNFYYYYYYYYYCFFLIFSYLKLKTCNMGLFDPALIKKNNRG